MQPFESYAQNFEDVMLWRVLKHVADGRYLDVGAASPVNDSVSYAFYQRGWRGVHVEPVPALAETLRRERPDELVINALVGDPAKAHAFFEVVGTGMSTAVVDYAESYARAGVEVRSVGSTLCISLAQALIAVNAAEIHWMKIDVEGLESEVLASWGDCELRPWIVVVESTMPNTRIESHDAWEHELLDRGYAFVYFDGLNRFYVSEQHPELRPAFSLGPNFFDDFVVSTSSPFGRAGAAAAAAATIEAAAKIADAESAAAQARAAAAVALQKAEALATECHALQAEREDLRSHVRRTEAERDAAIEQRDTLIAMESRVIATLRQATQLGEVTVNRLSSEIATLRSERAHFEQIASQQAAVIVALRESTSWRVTAPMRGASRVLRGLGVFGFSLGKSVLRGPLEAALRVLRRNPRLARFAVDVASRAPLVGPRLIRFAQARGYLAQQAPLPAPEIHLDAAPEALAHWRSKLVNGAG